MSVTSTSGTTASTAKRKADFASGDSNSPEVPAKISKVHPFFSRPDPSASVSAFRWIKPSLGPKHTCLHGVNLEPRSSSKVAMFDLDGTVIKSNFSKKKGAPAIQWEWWRNSVPSKLQELYQSGFSIIIVSNQALKHAQLEDWKRKIPLIAAALPNVPFRLFAATAKDGYRKPMPGIWYELERIFNGDNVTINKAESFFVGDAAGRTNDFASTDRKWAENLEIDFFTPEEYFLQLPPAQYKLPGFKASSVPVSSLPVPYSIAPAQSPEVVLFVGFPSMGKSSFYRRHFAPLQYSHINQDILGTRAKCVKAVEENLQKGVSCVVDNTNRDKPTRKLYLDIAKKYKVPARCFLFTGSIDLAWHNNLYRAYNMPLSVESSEPKRDLLPYLAFLGFRDNYEEPQLSEGFSDISVVDWIFEGDEDARKRWSMWLQIDGK